MVEVGSGVAKGCGSAKLVKEWRRRVKRRSVEMRPNG
jgi:hypothetical protein